MGLKCFVCNFSIPILHTSINTFQDIMKNSNIRCDDGDLDYDVDAIC